MATVLGVRGEFKPYCARGTERIFQRNNYCYLCVNKTFGMIDTYIALWQPDYARYPAEAITGKWEIWPCKAYYLNEIDFLKQAYDELKAL